jgi:hypothetical protein
MPRSRLCALALVPLLVVGATACGGRASVEQGAADAQVSAFLGDWVTPPACEAWLVASAGIKRDFVEEIAAGFAKAWDPISRADTLGVMDTACDKADDDTSMEIALGALYHFALVSRAAERAIGIRR